MEKLLVHQGIWQSLSIQVFKELNRIKAEITAVTTEKQKLLSDESAVGLVFIQRLRILAQDLEDQVNAAISAQIIVNDTI